MEVNSPIIYDPYHLRPEPSITSDNPLRTMRLKMADMNDVFRTFYAQYQIKRKIPAFDGGKFAAQAEPLYQRFIEAYIQRDGAAMSKMVTTTLADRLGVSKVASAGRGASPGRRRKQRAGRAARAQSDKRWHSGFRIVGFDEVSTVRQMRVLTETHTDRTVAYGQVTCRFHAQYAPVRYDAVTGTVDRACPMTLGEMPGLSLEASEPRWQRAWDDQGHPYFFHEGTEETTWQQPASLQQDAASASRPPQGLDRRIVVGVTRNEDPDHPRPEIWHTVEHVVFEARLLNARPTWMVAAF
jgi:hypothetical protein